MAFWKDSPVPVISRVQPASEIKSRKATLLANFPPWFVLTRRSPIFRPCVLMKVVTVETRGFLFANKNTQR